MLARHLTEWWDTEWCNDVNALLADNTLVCVWNPQAFAYTRQDLRLPVRCDGNRFTVGLLEHRRQFFVLSLTFFWKCMIKKVLHNLPLRVDHRWYVVVVMCVRAICEPSPQVSLTQRRSRKNAAPHDSVTGATLVAERGDVQSPGTNE